MSDALSTPFSETKSSVPPPQRLGVGQLSLLDISASTMANIGPAYSFFFGFGFLVVTAGLASPLMFVVAGIAVALLGNTLAQFSKVTPSTGGFVTFVGKTFGPASGITTALLVGAGYIIAISSVLAVSGGFLSELINHYFHHDIPWGILSVILTVGAIVTMVRGVSVSTRLAGAFFALEMVVLVVVSVYVILKHAGSLTMTPFQPSNITGGLGGLAAAFPLAVYCFIGWENSASLAEETDNPRRNVPKAIFLSVTLMTVGYVLFAYATLAGFGFSTDKLTATSIPFITVAEGTFSVLAFLAYFAGMTSTLGVLIAATNSQARMIFSAGREGLLPAWLGKVHPERRTPVNAIYAFIAIATALIVGWALGHMIGGHGTMSPYNYFAESATMGTILVLVVYLLSNLALPFYMRRHHADQFDVVRHGVLPFLGVVAIGVPMYYLAKPGQDPPYSWFPYLALAVIVVSVIYAVVLSQRDPTLSERVGSVVADE
jgi:amino acid transporter